MSDTTWWCEEHGSTILTREPDSYTLCLWMLYEDNWNALPEPEDCRMVERRLAPVDALVIERETGSRPIDNRWPEWAARVIEDMDHTEGHPVLDALASSQGEGPSTNSYQSKTELVVEASQGEGI